MAENKLRQYDLLVTSIHAVVLEPNKWDGLLRRIGEAVSATSGGFYLRDKATGKPLQWHSFGHSEAVIASYADKYLQIDPWTAIIDRTPVGEWICEHQHFDDRFVAQNEFFQHYMLPNGLRRVIGARAFDDGHNEAIIGFQRGLDAAPFNEGEAELLKRLSPHIELACRLSTEFSRLRMQAAVARQALDRLAAPLWVVDGEGRVLFANHAAEIGGLPGICVRQGRLVADAPNIHARLASLLQQASARQAQGGALALERTDGGRLTVLVAPLPADSPLAADSQRPLVLLMAHDPSVSEAQPLDVLAALYGLSPAECRLAALLLEGCTPSEAAERLQVQVSTVRTQLKSMFWKTGTHRQGELMKLLSGALLLKV
ncbi:hypothetical protein FNU76_21005 [Chitinimonas arctica]|uniref:HTH luxR-type domain-containing protein n=1 Tax=Chitinimonas arctica TaxID=2594795 RepID=A0A516SKE5_9NEIS|nr:hypothetical protein [Chitinimonas arctica]QDQ28632.1 hypothetical protein FNU76_21005 [Chitinimonas arctica]